MTAPLHLPPPRLRRLPADDLPTALGRGALLVDIRSAEQRAEQGGVVNALVIAPDTIAPPAGAQGLLGYFETYVIRGPGAFAEHAEDFDAYEAAMVRKLLKELQGMVVGAASPGPGAAMNGPETAMRGRETAGPTPGLAVR